MTTELAKSIIANKESYCKLEIQKAQQFLDNKKPKQDGKRY